MRTIVLLVAFFYPSLLLAQGPWNDPPRTEDHFWRRRVLMRVDLREKLNRPLIRSESAMYAPSEGTALNKYREGLVQALVDGFRAAEYIGYLPDSLDRVCTWDVFDAKLKRYVGGQPNADSGPASDNPTTSATEGEDPFGGGDDFGFGDDTDMLGDVDAAPTSDPTTTQTDRELYAGLRFILELVEDRVFDKNKSDMYYDIHYLRLIWVDPEGIYPYDVPLVAFKFEDVIPVLEQTQWKNWYNDAEYRSMLEIFQLRLFHGFIVDVSGNQSRSVDEAEKRRQVLIEFEHHLWEF